MKKKELIHWIKCFLITAFVLSCGDNLPGEENDEDQKTGNRLVKMSGEFSYAHYDDDKLLVNFGYDNNGRISQIKKFWDDVLDESISIIYGNDQIEYTSIEGGEKTVTTYYLNEQGYCYRESYSDNWYYNYDYNSNGQLIGIEKRWGSTDFTYPTEIKWKNGNVTEIIYKESSGEVYRKITLNYGKLKNKSFKNPIFNYNDFEGKQFHQSFFGKSSENLVSEVIDNYYREDIMYIDYNLTKAGYVDTYILQSTLDKNGPIKLTYE